MLRLSRSLRVSATRDTDKPEIQPVSEPKSLHSCFLSCVRVGQACISLKSGLKLSPRRQLESFVPRFNICT